MKNICEDCKMALPHDAIYKVCGNCEIVRNKNKVNKLIEKIYNSLSSEKIKINLIWEYDEYSFEAELNPAHNFSNINFLTMLDGIGQEGREVILDLLIHSNYSDESLEYLKRHFNCRVCDCKHGTHLIENANKDGK